MSFIQWPTLFGSTYFVPAMIVVALLLALLLLFSSRRRRQAQRARMAPERALVLPEEPAGDMFEGHPAQLGQDFGHSPSIVTQPVAMSTQPLVAMPAPSSGIQTVPLAPLASATPIEPLPAMHALPFETPGTEGFGSDSPAAGFGEFETSATERRSKRGRKAGKAAQAAPSRMIAPVLALSDPLAETIMDILNGWGELTIEDKKRIELFRPGRVSEALAGIQLPKTKTEDMKLRLDQLRRYAVNMERAEAAGPATPPSTAAPDASAGASAALHSAAVPDAAGAPPALPFAVPVVPPTTGRSFFDDGASSSRTTPSSQPTLSSAPIMTPEPVETPPEPLTVVPEPIAAAPQPHASGLDDKASEWASPRPLWQSDADEEEFEVLPAPAFDEIEVETMMSDPIAERPVQAPPVQAPVHITMGAPVMETPAVAKPAPSLGDIFWEDETSEPLSRIGIRVETAEQLLALPPSERQDMTAFLPPTELAATFRATQDLDLKKAVIDTLEHIGSAASLNALGACFEDQDPGIQVYALAAADRLLGVIG